MRKQFKHIIGLLFLVLTWTGFSVQAQYVTVKDPLFARFLKKNYSGAWVDSLNMLDTKAAEERSVADGIFDCAGYGFKNINEIRYFRLIDTIYAQNNKLKGLEGIEILPSVDMIDLSYNEFETLPQVYDIKTITYIYMHHNRLKSLTSKIANSKQTLKVLDVSHNQLESLPDLSGFTLAETFNLSHNRLTFEDLLPLTSLSEFESVFTYAPQNVQHFGNDTTIEAGIDFTLHFDIDRDVTSNTYYWYKDSVLIDSTGVNQLQLENVFVDNSGFYHVEVVNSNQELKNLRIYSDTMLVNVAECINFNNISISIKNRCERAVVQLTPEPPASGNYVFELTDQSNGKVLTSATGKFPELSAGIYQLTLSKSICHYEHPEDFTISNASDCDPVFSPNGDGLHDEYFIEAAGVAEIYDKSGKLVHTLKTPAKWKGEGQDGATLPPGYYLIRINNEQIYITLER